MDWPDTGEQVRRMEAALEVIGRLLDRERVDHEPTASACCPR
jgi:alkanesulfonate monooxygenase SsuD/methylene tetrahydromethanopterin reductase-like flavin-dependent oxidoreductase (luciferase family)